MVHPDKVGVEAKKKEDENFKFRTFLKGHADEEELDEQFLRLHKELFADYDCSKCRNCCKMYKGSIPDEDLEKDAEYLGITVEQFVDFFLEKEELGIGYHTKHKPCDLQRKIIKDLELALRYYDGTDLKEHNLFRFGKMSGNFI